MKGGLGRDQEMVSGDGTALPAVGVYTVLQILDQIQEGTQYCQGENFLLCCGGMGAQGPH